MRRCARGFTLIEAMSAVIVLASLGSIASFLVLDAVDGYVEASTAAQVHSEATIALDRIVREVRRIPGHATEAAPAVNFTAVYGGAIHWEDESADTWNVTTVATNMFLKIGSNVGADLILADVTGFTVEAFDEDNASVALPVTTPATVAPIRRLTLTLTVTREGVVDTLRTKIYLRAAMAGAG